MRNHKDQEYFWNEFLRKRVSHHRNKEFSLRVFFLEIQQYLGNKRSTFEIRSQDTVSLSNKILVTNIMRLFLASRDQ